MFNIFQQNVLLIVEFCRFELKEMCRFLFCSVWNATEKCTPFPQVHRWLLYLYSVIAEQMGRHSARGCCFPTTSKIIPERHSTFYLYLTFFDQFKEHILLQFFILIGLIYLKLFGVHFCYTFSMQLDSWSSVPLIGLIVA